MVAPLYLHIGLKAWGTTHLQRLLRANAGEALAQGVGVFPKKRAAGFRMALDLRGLAGSSHHPHGEGSFQRFPHRLARTEGERIVFGEEALAGCTAADVATLGKALGEREVHLVLAVGDIARTIPAMWEQAVAEGRSIDYESYVQAVVDGHGTAAEHFWTAQDVPAILSRWSALVPPERTHVVTAPRSGESAHSLRDRFCTVLGLDPTRLVSGQRRADDSLGRTQVEVLRRINARLPPEAQGGALYGRLIKRPLVSGVLAKQPAEEIRLPREHADWCEEHARATVAAIRDGGYPVVGDLSELLPDESVYADGVSPVDEGAVAEAAVDGLAMIMNDRIATHLAEEERSASARAREERADAQAALVSEPSRGRVRSLAVRAARKARSLT